LCSWRSVLKMRLLHCVRNDGEVRLLRASQWRHLKGERASHRTAACQ
jgi:uncharacterized protein Usg